MTGMNDVAVLIPYGNETPWRKHAYEHVVRWHRQELDAVTIQVGSGGDPWCKAKAVASALKSTTEPIIVIADADCITPGLGQAVTAVRNGAPWAMPHLKVYRMGQAASRNIYDGIAPGSLTGRTTWLDQNPYKGYEGGGITVLRRDVYLDAPLDPEFTGWGQEDEAWALALNSLYGPPWRGVAPLYHLWHEKPPRMSRYAGSAHSVTRLKSYKEVRSRDEWAQLLLPARELASFVSTSL